MQILDYSGGYPRPSEIAHRGYGGAIRYLRKEGTSDVQPLTADEVKRFRDQGLALAVIYQHVDKYRTLKGYDAGRHDAHWAIDQCDFVGYNPRGIYFAVDFDTTSTNRATISTYFQGVVDVLGLDCIGVYGEYDVLEHLALDHLITWGWQTYAWSTGHNQDNQPRHPRANLFQRQGTVTVDGIPCDVNDVLTADFGQEGLTMTCNFGSVQDGRVVQILDAVDMINRKMDTLLGQVADLTGKVDAQAAKVDAILTEGLTGSGEIRFSPANQVR